MSRIEINKNGGKIGFSVKGDTLQISGDNTRLVLFAENLPYDLNEGLNHYHCHFDRIGHEDHFVEDSRDTILAMSHRPKS